MYSHTEIKTFQSILKPLYDIGTIPQDVFDVALKALKDHLHGQPSVNNALAPKHEILISRKDAAQMLGCCTRTVDRLRKEGKLAAVQYGTASVRFRESDVIALQNPSVSTTGGEL